MIGRVVLFLVIAAGVAAVALFFHYAERNEVEHERGFVGEARANPLLALERTLTALGAEVRSTAEDELEPSATDTVLWRGTGAMSTPKAIDRMAQWVEGGGHLVVVLPSSGTYREYLDADVDAAKGFDPLLLAFGVFLERGEVGAERDTQELRLPDRTKFEVELTDALVLRSSAANGISRVRRERDRSSSQAMQLEWGAGTFTVFTESDWLENASLGEHDHAALAFALLAPRTPGAALWVDRRGEVPDLFAWLVTRGWPFLAGCGFLLATVLLRVTRRFGPPLPELSGDRRDFAEHLDAVGQLHWRLQQSGQLLDALRADLRARIELMRSEWRGLDDATLAQELAKVSGLSAAASRAALTKTDTHHPTEFLRLVADLRTLRASL